MSKSTSSPLTRPRRIHFSLSGLIPAACSANSHIANSIPAVCCGEASCEFFHPRKIVDRDLELALLKTVPAHPARGHLLCYEFAMRRPDAKQTIGIIHLRIGYKVEPRYRGHRYVARSCRWRSPTALRGYG